MFQILGRTIDLHNYASLESLQSMYTTDSNNSDIPYASASMIAL